MIDPVAVGCGYFSQGGVFCCGGRRRGLWLWLGGGRREGSCEVDGRAGRGLGDGV